jgi:hypothetical protein
MPNEPVEYLSDNSLEARLEPFDGLLTLDLVRSTDVGLASATLGNTLTRSGPTNSQHNFKPILVDVAATHMQQ